MAPGQRAEVSTTGKLVVQQVDLVKTSAWRDGKLIFDDTPLAEAVAEVNRYGGKQVVLGDPALQRLHISGTFHTSRPEAFVEGATAALPVRLEASSADRMVLGPA
jgi:transmembrane sensor